MELKEDLENQIKYIAKEFLLESQNKNIYVISHFDTDGITSAAIMIQTLKKIDKQFSIKIIKSLEKEFISTLPKNSIILFLDLASSNLEHISQGNFHAVYVIDHHEISTDSIPSNIKIINPHLNTKSKISASGLTYLFCKELDKDAKDFAKLAILGMIGDRLESEVGKLNHGIIDDGDIKRKRGLLIYPSTRPLNRTLEYCSNPYIPGVTGDSIGTFDLLKETGINPTQGKYPALIELNDEEMQRLVTAITLRVPKQIQDKIIGDIFLIKLFNKVEDARELSAVINACSRLGNPEVALQLCMEIPSSKKKAEAIHAKYKQHLISGLNFVADSDSIEKIEGKGFVIINAKAQIRETIIGTIASIISSSAKYEEGTIITAMAYYENKIKVSLRNSGGQGRNLREVIANVIDIIGGEVGGHHNAAGAIIRQDQEEEFINLLKKHLEIEFVKV